MAQPIFDEHPLQDYLRRSLHSHQRKTSHAYTHTHPLFTESGDIFEPIPGAISGLSCPFSDGCVDEPDHDLKLCSWLTTPVSRLAEVSSVPHYLSWRARSVGRSDCCKHLGGSMCHRVLRQRSLDLH